ncbi:MAG: hypothetical protein L6282_01460 [Candidatus Methanoperedenaceae archaeon]|nr:hypothetical protein [Candidatus Methanoperedenaceae archaeon]
MKLTDNEIRDINKYIEEGKPLPENYRFLLFEDKREVELVWNGKTNEVCNVVLPFQVIEQVDEPRAEKNVSFQKTLFDIDYRGRQQKGWTNKLIWGDNKLILSSLKNGSNKIVVENGQIIKVIKDKNGIIRRETLTKKWTDWIDYWSVDFDFENKKEIIQIRNADNQIKEVWTGDFVFENEWQSFRTKKNRTLEMISIFKECTKGRKKIAVKVVDIFGNDTMKIIEVTI